MIPTELIAWAKVKHRKYCEIAEFYLDSFKVEFKPPKFSLYANLELKHICLPAEIKCEKKRS